MFMSQGTSNISITTMSTTSTSILRAILQGEPHAHRHKHARLKHTHAHYPDMHHRHDH